jgi:Zn-dependent oligopeptidase
MKEAKETIDNMLKTKGPRTFDNTIKVLAKFESDFSRKSTILGFYSQVSTSAEIREASR